MTLNKLQKNKMVEYFTVHMTMVDIGKIYKISRQRVRQIIMAELGPDKFNKVKERKLKKNNFYFKYHNDKKFREAYIDRVKKRQYKNQPH